MTIQKEGIEETRGEETMSCNLRGYPGEEQNNKMRE